MPDTGGAGVPAGTTGVESPIGADLVGIVENLLMLGEEMIVMWANNNLRFPQFSYVAWVPDESRDRNKPIQYVLTASRNSSGNLPSYRTARRASPREGKGSCRRELRPVEAPPLCPRDRAQLCGDHHTRKRGSVSASFLLSVEQMSSVKAPAQKNTVWRSQNRKPLP